MQLTQGLARIRAGKGRLTRTVLFTCLDWGFAMISLWLCFRAVGVSLPVGHLSAAFTTGQAATLIISGRRSFGPFRIQFPGGHGTISGAPAVRASEGL